jgi:ArsR family metal-binding transcriptional regulator
VLVNKTELFNSKCNPSAPAVNVAIHLGEDIADLLPYLNATQQKARYTASVPFVRFMWHGHVVNVEKSVVRAFGFETDGEAREAAPRLLRHIEGVREARDEIEPDHESHEPPSVLDVLRHLPRLSRCSACGQPSCLAFASAVSRGDCDIALCAPLQEDRFAGKLKALLEIVG